MRWGALRAVVEATGRASAGVVLNELLAQTATHEQLWMELAEVLGEARIIEREGLLEALSNVPTAAARRFLERLLATATLVTNRSWLTWIARLPSRRDWAATTAELPETFVEHVCDLLELCAKQGLSAAPAGRLVDAFEHGSLLTGSVRTS